MPAELLQSLTHPVRSRTANRRLGAVLAFAAGAGPAAGS